MEGSAPIGSHSYPLPSPSSPTPWPTGQIVYPWGIHPMQAYYSMPAMMGAMGAMSPQQPFVPYWAIPQHGMELGSPQGLSGMQGIPSMRSSRLKPDAGGPLPSPYSTEPNANDVYSMMQPQMIAGHMEVGGGEGTTDLTQPPPHPPFRAGRTSRFKGITPHHGRWQARIKINRRDVHLGYYDTGMPSVPFSSPTLDYPSPGAA